MKIIVTVDDGYAMMFNHRRVSRDRVLNARILELTRGKKLWMNRYSAALFPDAGKEICVDEAFLDRAGAGDYCFVEDQKLAKYKDKIWELILCRWNRTYPGDFRLDLIPEKNGMTCIRREEFRGSSHERITMETWKQK